MCVDGWAAGGVDAGQVKNGCKVTRKEKGTMEKRIHRNFKNANFPHINHENGNKQLLIIYLKLKG